MNRVGDTGVVSSMFYQNMLKSESGTHKRYSPLTSGQDHRFSHTRLAERRARTHKDSVTRVPDEGVVDAASPDHLYGDFNTDRGSCVLNRIDRRDEVERIERQIDEQGHDLGYALSIHTSPR